MLTPRFELSQDDDFLILVIYAPFAKVSDTEFFIEGEEIRFYSKPYYLRLHLPKAVKEDDRTEAKYDVDKGCFTAKITKMTSGEVFEGLDMLTKLLTPPGETSAACPRIEDDGGSAGEEPDGQSARDCGSHTPAPADNGDADCAEEEEENWFIEQQVPSENSDNLITGAVKYGFACQRSGVFTKLMSEFSEILDVKDPDSLSSVEVRAQRIAHEAEHFSEDHYLADLYDNEEIAAMLTFEPWWTSSDKCKLSEEEKDQLLKLPRKQHLIEKDALPCVYYGLMDLIFAYAYSHRVMGGEDNVESGWTIAKLSATLSWLDTFTSVQDVLVSCFRRALTFPLYRNWDLCVKLCEDVQKLFSCGKLCLLKCLLDIHRCMIVSDPRYIFSDLYIIDYCVWIQSADDKKLVSLAQKILETKLTKGDVGFDLEQLESAAEMVLQEEADAELDVITTGVKCMGVTESESVLDSDDDDDSDDDSEETDSEESDSDDDGGSDKIVNDVSGATDNTFTTASTNTDRDANKQTEEKLQNYRNY